MIPDTFLLSINQLPLSSEPIVVPKTRSVTLVPLEEISKWHLDLITQLEVLLPDKWRFCITSIRTDYSGKPRTKENGSNHVSSDAIDIVFLSPDNEILMGGMYSSSLFWMSHVFKCVQKLSIPVTIGFETDHYHFHLGIRDEDATVDDSSVSAVLFQSPRRGTIYDDISLISSCSCSHIRINITKLLQHLSKSISL